MAVGTGVTWPGDSQVPEPSHSALVLTLGARFVAFPMRQDRRELWPDS
jgi:hypothetical protein